MYEVSQRNLATAVTALTQARIFYLIMSGARKPSRCSAGLSCGEEMSRRPVEMRR